MLGRLRSAAPIRLVLVGAAACCAVAVAPAAGSVQGPPPPGLGLRLLEAPTARADDPRARAYVVDRVRPGGSFTRAIEVMNGDDAPIDVRLYPAAAQVAEGSFTVKDAGVPGEIVNWTTVTPTSLQIAPRSRVRAQVTVRVDPKATEGEYYGGIVAERPAAPGEQGVGINLRVAIRVYLSVGPGGEPASDFVVDTLTAQRGPGGEPVVLASVKNTGGRALDMSGTLRLTDGPGGLSAGPFDAMLGTTLAPGQSSPVTVVLDKALPAGPWLARLDLKSGLVERSATATITFPEQGEAAPVEADPVVVEEESPPWPLIAGGVAVLLLLVGLALLLLKRRSKPDDNKQAPVVVGPPA